MTAYEIIAKKRDGLSLSVDEINYFINGYLQGHIPEYQMSAILMAIYFKGMDEKETLHLTEAYLHSGQIITFEDTDTLRVDKHSTGGVGDKVSIILAPLVAAAGVAVPMISGRGLGHSGGTLDKLESITGFRVNLGIGEFKQIIDQIGVCMIGQTPELTPADKRIYALRDVTATIQSIPLITASIMSKKIASGIDALVLDVKTGRGAFMEDEYRARLLAKTLIGIGEQAGKNTVAYLTRMDQPLGNAVGNWLEIKECIDCLQGSGPADLIEVTVHLAGAMIHLGGKSDSIAKGKQVARELLGEGHAWQKFREMVQIQGGDLAVIENPDSYSKAKYIRDVPSETEGWIQDIDALEVGLTAVQLGAGRQKAEDGIDPKAGIFFYKKCGDYIKQGNILFTVHTDRKEVLEDSIQRIKNAITLTTAKASVPPIIIDFLDKTNLKD